MRADIAFSIDVAGGTEGGERDRYHRMKAMHTFLKGKAENGAKKGEPN